MAKTILLVLLLTQINGLPDCPDTIGVMFITQPQNTTVCVGSQAMMNCTYMGVESIPLWLINGTIYPSQESNNMLPPHHRYNGRALILNTAFLEENDTTYQCFFNLFNSEDGSLCQLKSTVGKLTVVANDDCERRPENITRTVGETDVFIPCTVSGYNPQIWEINGLIYELFQLPEIFTPTYGGISIKVIENNLNGISFRCYTSTGAGYMVEASSTSYLTVTSRGGSVSFHDDNSDLYIDHQSTFFDENITLSWKPVNDPQCIDYEVVSRSRCEQTSPVESKWRTSRQLSTDIPAEYLSVNGSGNNRKRANIFIKATNHDNGFVCNQTEATMQVQNSVITKKLNSSFATTQTFKFSTMKNSIFNLVIPRSGTWEDCFCPIFFHRDATCYNLTTCSCVGDTVFNNSLIKLCLLSADDDISIQIQNLANEMNGNRLSIFHEFFCKYNLKFIPPYRIYTNSFEVAIVLPEQPNVKVDVESKELCILPYGENENPPDSYSILVYDITGEAILLQNNIVPKFNSSTCISIYNVTEQYSSECAPLLVLVNAFNAFGQVDTTISIPSENVTGDVCSCLNETVSLSWTPVAKVDSIALNISCHQTKYATDFELEAAISPGIKMAILCKSEEIVLDGLSCDTSYNISIYWKSPKVTLDVQCLLLRHMDLKVQCKGRPWILYTVPASVAVLFFIMVLIFQVISVVFYQRCYQKTHDQFNVNEENENYQDYESGYYNITMEDI